MSQGRFSGTAALTLALALAAALRCAFLLELGPYPRHERILNSKDDQTFLAEWGEAMARGEPHGRTKPRAKRPDLPPRAPLYPAILAAVQRLGGESPLWVRALQALAGLGSVLLLHRLTRLRWGEPAASAAAFLGALYAPWIFYEVTFLRTTFLVLAFGGLVTAFDRLARSEGAGMAKRRGTAVAAGLLAGAAILLQEQFVLLAGAGLVWLWRRRRESAPWLLLGLTLALAPIVLWASWRAGRPVLSTSSAPHNLVLANLHDASGDSVAPTPTYAEIHRRAKLGQVSMLRELGRDIAAHPGALMRLLGRKLYYLVRPVDISDNLSFDLGRREHRVLRLVPFDYPTLLPLALLGAALALRERRPAAPLFTFAALYASSLVAFIPLGRLREPLAFVVIALAAAGGAELWRRLGRRRGLAIAAIVGLLLVGLALRPAPERSIRTIDWHMAAGAWENEAIARRSAGDLAAARRALIEARVRDPSGDRILARLAALDREIGTPSLPPLPAEAERLCEEGVAAAERSELGRARRLFTQASKFAPDHPRPWQLLSNLHFVRGDPARAARALERALAADPYDPLLAHNLAALRP